MKINRFSALLAAVLMLICLCSCGKPAYSTDPDERESLSEIAGISRDRLRVIGHRGLSSKAPENTLVSFELACEAGDWGVEMDAFPTADGQWVVMHDKTVSRMTGGRGKIKNMTCAEIAGLSIDSGNNVGLYPTQKVPLLSEVLDLTEKYETVPVIEIKDTSEKATERLAGIIKDYPDYRDFIIISFSGDALLSMKKYLPDNTMWLLVKKIDEAVIAYALTCGFDGLDFECRKTPDAFVEMAVEAGLEANAWTVDDVERASELLDLGCGAITTNVLVP